MTDLTGRVAIVTGAARGQGRAIALRLAAAGAAVIAGDVLTDDLATLAGELGDSVLTGELDIRDRSSWDALIERGVGTFGRLDILANNAGVLRVVPLVEETAEAFENIWRVNCLGAFHGIQAVVPHMRAAGGGSIVNTASTAAKWSYNGHGAYASSKWANLGLTKAAAFELAQYRIRVNAVLPGPIDTPMVLPDNDPVARERLSNTLLGRIGTPEDIAEAVLYLASDASSFVTGTELVVDGGQTIGKVLPPT